MIAAAATFPRSLQEGSGILAWTMPGFPAPLSMLKTQGLQKVRSWQRWKCAAPGCSNKFRFAIARVQYLSLARERSTVYKKTGVERAGVYTRGENKS